jgi:hypothetical protein
MEHTLEMRYPPYTPDNVEFFAAQLGQEIPESSAPVSNGDKA